MLTPNSTASRHEIISSVCLRFLSCRLLPISVVFLCIIFAVFTFATFHVHLLHVCCSLLFHHLLIIGASHFLPYCVPGFFWHTSNTIYEFLSCLHEQFDDFCSSDSIQQSFRLIN